MIGALGGVGLTGLIAFGTATLTHRWDKEKSQRTRESEVIERRGALRRETYANYLATAASFEGSLQSVLPPDASLSEAERERQLGERVEETAYHASFLAAQLVAGWSVSSALHEYDDWVSEQLNKVFEGAQSSAFVDGGDRERVLIAAMRLELSDEFADDQRLSRLSERRR